MKKLILSAITIATMITSCKKENIKNVTPDSGATSELNDAHLAARTVPNGNMENYLADPNDPQNERINKALYKYMEGMKKVLESDPSYLSQILNLAKTTPIKTIDLHEFVCGTAICKTIFNGELCAKYPEKGTNYDYCMELLKEMDYKYLTYDKVSYEPGMYVINADVADLTKGYYLALAEEVYNADVNHDYIPTWHIEKNGNVKLELINEQQARMSSEPIIIFAPMPAGRYAGTGTYQAPVYLPPVPLQDPYIPPAPPTNLPWTPTQVYHFTGQVSQHFESYGASDYRISQAVTDQNGSLVQTPFALNRNLKDISNSTISNYSTFVFGQIPFYYATSYNTVIHFVTYEYDWYAPERFITPGAQTLQFYAKFEHERYETVGNRATGSFLPNTGSYSFNDQGQIHTVVR